MIDSTSLWNSPKSTNWKNDREFHQVNRDYLFEVGNSIIPKLGTMFFSIVLDFLQMDIS